MSSHTWCQSQLISRAITGSITHRGKLMVSARSLGLFALLLQAKWHGELALCLLRWPRIPSVFTHPLLCHFYPTLPLHLINTLLSAVICHFVWLWCPAAVHHHQNSLKTEFTCCYCDSQELSLCTSTNKHSPTNMGTSTMPHTSICLIMCGYCTYTFWIWCALPNRLSNIYNKLVRGSWAGILNPATNFKVDAINICTS